MPAATHLDTYLTLCMYATALDMPPQYIRIGRDQLTLGNYVGECVTRADWQKSDRLRGQKG